MKQKLENIGFVVHSNKKGKLNQASLNRYPNLPQGYLSFLAETEYCATKDEKAWFNTLADFNGTAENEFRWNEFELMILEDDDEDAQEIIEFWDNHIPVLLSCRNFYCYFAISLLADNYGQIVYGCDPNLKKQNG